MKKFPVWLLVTLIALFVIGLVWAIVGGLMGGGFAIHWLAPLGLWLTDIIWAAIYAARHPRKKTPARTLLMGNNIVNQRISKETDEAVARYVGSVTRKGLLKKSALYERPWFLACGLKKSGKTSLLKGAGLNFPLRYPSEKDGLQLEGSDQVSWNFGNEAVWIDTPGSFMEDENRDSWQALLASLLRVRPENPVDGVALIVDAREIHSSDDRTVKEMAKKLRSRIDELISTWGIEFPVYLIFNHSDEIPGFNEYYGDHHGKGQETIFGSTMSAEQDKIMPRFAFAEEFRLLAKSLTDLRLDKLVRENDAANRRMICRFVIHFEAMQEKLGAFVSELFKPTNYEGKPIFRGFYFTSCQPKMSAEKQDIQTAQNLGMTIAAHPLNPKKMLGIEQTPEQKTGPKKEEIQSLFVLPLFKEIMVRDKRLVKTTQKRGRQELVRHYSIAAVIMLFSVVLCALMISGLTKASALYASINSELSGVKPSETTLFDAYHGLEIVGQTVARLQKFEDKGAPVGIAAFGFYQGKTILVELNKLYFNLIQRLVVSPAVKYYEYTIWESAQDYKNLTGDQYNALYNSLKAYLSMSEAVSGRAKDIDTAFMREELLGAVKQSLLSKYQQQRLPEQIETILQTNMGMYLLYCKRGQFPPVQENQRLVMAARTKLRRLPDAQTLYESVMSGFSQDAPKITLDQMLNRKDEGILKSDKDISVLYTQEGWDKFVSEGISKTSKDPFKLDWVIGLPADQASEASVDTKQLYNDMVAAYLTDFKSKWLEFLQSVHLEPFGDLTRSSRMLQKLTADKSELAVILETVSNYTVMKKESVAEKEGASVLEAASKFKATKALAKNAKKAMSTAESAMSFTLGEKSPFDDLNATFDPLRTFTRSTGGALSGYEGYRDKIKTLVEKLATLETQGDQYALTVFSGKDDDPLLAGWKYCQSSLSNMPEALGAALRGVLLSPIDFTGSAASKVLTKTLNARWHSEIVKPFTSRFSGRYPFSSRGEDASFSDVMDFFRPSTGTFWGFYDRVLSPFVVKTSNGWMVRTVGSLKLTFNPTLSTSLISAERIRDIFFKPDGTQRTLSITLSPSSSNKGGAKLDVNGQTFDFPPGGRSQQINWPVETQPLNASLKIMVNGDFTEDITFNGPWGFLKLVQASHTNKINNSTFSAKWQVNVQNMYVVYQDFRVQVSGNDHPFGDPIFTLFDCPTDLVVEVPEPKADPNQAGQSSDNNRTSIPVSP